MRSIRLWAALSWLVILSLSGGVEAATSLSVCRDWTNQGGVACGGQIPQGAPWITVLVQDLSKGRFNLVVTGPEGPGTPLTISREGRSWWWVITGTRLTPPAAGDYTVTVTDQATGATAAQIGYTVVAQTPQQAVTAWHDARQPFAVLGLAIAQWRLGDKAKARESAQSLLASSRFMPDVYTARRLFFAMAMNDRDYPQAVDAAQSIIDGKRANSQVIQPGDYLALITALIGACRLDQARTVLVEGLREYPNVRAMTNVTGEIEASRQKCP